MPSGKCQYYVVDSGLNFVEPLGSLEGDSDFQFPSLLLKSLPRLNPKAMVRVEGVVRSQQPGESVTIWDDRGRFALLPNSGARCNW